MRLLQILAVTTTSLVFSLACSAAAAQHHSAELSVAVPPEDIAESIIVFVPAVDTPMVTGAEPVYLKGRIIAVERGARPGAIVMNPHTLWGSRPAGIAMRMYLVRHPDKDAYYPIYGAPFEGGDVAAASASPELAVRVTTPLGDTVHAVNLMGVPYSFSASLRIPAGAGQDSADLYFGITQAEGTDSYTWTSPAGHPYLGKGMQPLLRGIALDRAALLDAAELVGRELTHTFNGNEAPGMYLVFATLVKAGTDPGDTANWLVADMQPLFVE